MKGINIKAGLSDISIKAGPMVGSTPTGRLRFVRRGFGLPDTLQQEWDITEYDGGNPANKVFQWINVPVVDDK